MYGDDMGEFEQNRESVNEKAGRIVKAIFRSMKSSDKFLPVFKEMSETELEKMCPALVEAVVELINDGVKPNLHVVKQRILPRMFNSGRGQSDGSPESFFAYKYRDLGTPEINEIATKILVAMTSDM